MSLERVLNYRRLAFYLPALGMDEFLRKFWEKPFTNINFTLT